MARIDFYVQHLFRQNASEVELVSGEPVRLMLPEGERRSQKPVEHIQITGLVQEVAPPDSLHALLRESRCSFAYTSEGAEVQVSVTVLSKDSWSVKIAPAPLRAAAGGAQAYPYSDIQDEPSIGEEAKAAASVRPPRRTVPPPQVQISEGEPKINRYLRMMFKLGASDLHLSARCVPMVRLHGSMQELEGEKELSAQQLQQLFSEIMPERNAAEFAETNDTDFAHSITGVARFRSNIFSDHKGPGAVFRQIPFDIIPYDKLGIPEKALDLCWLSKGLVVVTGPTGSGKSTTMAALIDVINRKRRDHIITIEDPIEFVHQNKSCLINQREVGIHTKSFKRALRAALREDPDIVLVGEMRDLETIAIAIETAETGHLVFGTLHTTSAVSTVDRIIDQFPPDQQSQIRVMLSESIRGVIAQMLCKKIGGGRVAAYEILLSNTAVSNLIREGKTFQLASVMQTSRNIGMQLMNDHLFQLVKDGIVEPEEAYIKTNNRTQLKDMFTKAQIPLRLE